ncbi:MAG: glycosyl hydrolase, partial [bacterium]|nr:glycosyl hydrolase [bacterium]
PERTYVADLTASLHDDDTVFAVFNNHKSGDFQPYVLRSGDRGRSWTLIAGDLPNRHVVWSIVEDHERAELLFAGTEFGLFFTIDGGGHWIELTGGVPTVAFRDLEIQRRENDLVAATFGRGIYILDDTTPLREVTPELLAREGWLFPVKKTWMYLPARPLGWGEKAFQGNAFYTAPNPPFGAVFTYHLKEEVKTRKQVRREAEQKIREEGGDVYPPSWDELRIEDREEPPAVLMTVTDEEGNVVRRLTGPTAAGIHRVAWDLRYPEMEPTKLEAGDFFDDFFDGEPGGPMVVPGRYTVSMARRVDGVLTPLGEARTFETVPLGLASLAAPDKEALLAFQRKAGRLQRAVLAANEVVADVSMRLRHVKQALHDTPDAGPELAGEARALELRLMDIDRELTGDRVVARRSEPTSPSITDRVQRVIGAYWESTSAATTTHQRNYDIAAEAFAEVLEKLRGLVEDDLGRLEEAMEKAGAPWTPGRGVPEWEPE